MTEQFGTSTEKPRGRAKKSLDLIAAMWTIAIAAQPITGNLANGYSQPVRVRLTSPGAGRAQARRARCNRAAGGA